MLNCNIYKSGWLKFRLTMEGKLQKIKDALDRYGRLTRMPNAELAMLYEQIFETPARINCGACIGGYVNQLRKFYSANVPDCKQ